MKKKINRISKQTKLLKFSLFVLSQIVFSFSAYSQSHTVCGYLKDETNGEPVLYAECRDASGKHSAVSNEFGFFGISFPSENIKFRISHPGFQTDSVEFVLTKDTILYIKLKPWELDEVTITGKSTSNYKQTGSGHERISPKTINAIPSFLGEPDLLKALTCMPGITTGNKGFSDIYVRGGERSENLMLLDGAPFYGSQHAWGLISIYNTDIIQTIDVYKGGFPARYGDRTASVLDIRTKQGNNKKFQGNYSVGLLNTKFTVEGPLRKEKTSFIFGFRSSYYDLLILPIRRQYNKNNSGSFMGYTFLDANLKINHSFNNKNKVFFNFYSGYDIQGIYDKSSNSNNLNEEETKLRQDNISATLGYTTNLSPKLYFSSALIYSKYGNLYKSNTAHTNNDVLLKSNEHFYSKIEDISANLNFDYRVNQFNTFKFGAKYNFYTFSPGIFKYHTEDSYNTTDTVFGNNISQYANEIAVYAEDEIKFTDKVSINAGLRASAFNKNKTYTSLDPRFSVRWQFLKNTAFKASYTKTTQFLHGITNNMQGINGETWKLSTQKVPSIKSDQVSAGFFGEISKLHIEFSGEVYYKISKNLIFFKYMNSDLLIETNWEDNVLKNGKGESYGFESMIKYNSEKLNISLSYTHSYTYRQFAELNGGKRFPFLYDKRNDIFLFTEFNMNEKNSFSANFVFSTGTPITLAQAYVKADEFSYEYYAYNGLNNMRLPNYHRLDISYKHSYVKNKKKKYISINIFNVYARQNPVYIYFDGEKMKQISFYSIIPSISYGMYF